jgi:glycosyltransferase involved in cell wall biosynthesis
MTENGNRELSSSTPEISVVIPVFDEKENVVPLTGELLQVLSSLGRSFEIIFIDDGSRDGTTEKLRELARHTDGVGLIVFRKNFGKAAALLAGFERSQGEFVITMDGDQQDDPAEIPRLIDRLEQGDDLVSGWKRKRRDPLGKVIPSRVFNMATSLIGGLRLHDYNCGLKGYRRTVIDNLDLYGELHRYIPVLAHRKGFRVGELAVNHRPRKHGRSKYGFSRGPKGFLDLITVFFLTRFTRRPLHLFGAVGLIFFMVGFAINAYLSVLWIQGRNIGHRPLLFLGILCVIVGIQMLSTGLLGEMMANFNNRRQRDYVIREEI